MAMFSKSMKRASRCSSWALTAKTSSCAGVALADGSPLPDRGPRRDRPGGAPEPRGWVRVAHRAHGEKDGTSVPSGTYRSTVATEALRSNDRILQKALELFSEKGYDATSVREICEAAGITKPTLYHFYGSKEGVYRAIVEGALERFRADMVRALGGRGHPPGPARPHGPRLRGRHAAGARPRALHHGAHPQPATVGAGHRLRRLLRGHPRRARARGGGGGPAGGGWPRGRPTCASSSSWAPWARRCTATCWWDARS